MLGNAKPFFTLIKQSSNREEVERAAAEYESKHPGEKAVIDCWRDHLQQVHTDQGIWRARVKIPDKRTLFQKILGR